MPLYRRKRKLPTYDGPSDYRELWAAVIMLVVVGIILSAVYHFSQPAPSDARLPPSQSQPRTP